MEEPRGTQAPWRRRAIENLAANDSEFLSRLERSVDSSWKPLGPHSSRRHHFVPKFFLRRFADGEHLERIRLDQPNEHQVAQVNDIAVMKDLYTVVDDELGETVAFEDILAAIDHSAGEAIGRLAFGVLFPPKERDAQDLAFWISLLRLRSPGQRRKAEAIAESWYKALLVVNDPDAVVSYEAFAPDQSQLVETMLRDALAATPYLLCRRWTVARFAEVGTLITDNPAILHVNPWNRSEGRGVGIANADEIWMPLDRQTALLLHSNDSISEGFIQAPHDFGVDDLNQLLVTHATDEIYCHRQISGD